MFDLRSYAAFFKLSARSDFVAGRVDVLGALPSYDLSTIKAATNDFSVDNKLGEGGFGVVYMVYFSLLK